jgi:hypothetical protein
MPVTLPATGPVSAPVMATTAPPAPTPPNSDSTGLFHGQSVGVNATNRVRPDHPSIPASSFRACLTRRACRSLPVSRSAAASTSGRKSRKNDPPGPRRSSGGSRIGISGSLTSLNTGPVSNSDPVPEAALNFPRDLPATKRPQPEPTPDRPSRTFHQTATAALRSDRRPPPRSFCSVFAEHSGATLRLVPISLLDPIDRTVPVHSLFEELCSGYGSKSESLRQVYLDGV